jgi:hypothetical protein
MKNKNQRDLEKYWAEKQKKAAKPVKAAPKKNSREDINQTAPRTVGEATKD